MTSPHLERAYLLIQQARWALAQQELEQALGADPQHAPARALLALCLAEREQLARATEEVRQAIQLAPDLAYAHFVHARVLHARNHDQDALAAVREAVRLDPSDPDYAAHEAAILLDQKQWAEGLAAAERGLRADAEHIGCTNLRALSLQKLGRRMEAGEALEHALARNPEHDLTHATRGWALLEAGRTDQALHHFREALRLDPDNAWARHGVIEALKSRHTLYTVFLKYAFFMARLSTGAQWGIILGGYLVMRLLRTAADARPSLAPWILPVQVLYLAFVLLTWTAEPLFNLLLRLNRLGRLALTREERIASNWVGACVGLSLTALGVGIGLGGKQPWLVAALILAGLIIPLAGTFKCPSGWPRRAMAGYTAAMALAGLLLLLAPVLPAGIQPRTSSLFLVFLLGLLGSSWVANLLASQQVRR